MDFNDIFENPLFSFNDPSSPCSDLVPDLPCWRQESSFNKDKEYIRKRNSETKNNYRKKRKIDKEMHGLASCQSRVFHENLNTSEDFPLTDFNEPEILLYENSNTSLKEFLMIFLKFKTMYKLKDNLSVCILKLIKAVLPQPNNCPVSLQFIFDLLNTKQEADHHQICEHQHVYKKLDFKKNISTDKCTQCDYLSSFIIFDISSQVEEILDRKYLLHQIKNSNSISNTKEYILEKQTDGTIYNEASKNKSDLIISLNINSDGAPLCESTKHNIWPLLATIVELDNSSREKFENMIFLGFWLNKTKPHQTFFKKCVEKLLESIKMSRNDSNDYNYILRAHSLIADLPAKAMLLNTKQFNGEFGCISCLEKGQYDNELFKRIYTNTNFEPRDNKDYEECAEKADQTKSTIFGINGVTPFSKVLKIPEQIPFDYMHLVLQGHCKWLLKQYFEESKKSKFYIGKKVIQINKILSKTKLPHNFNRKIHNITDTKQWKSTQYKTFLFYLMIPTFMHILPDKYFYHLSSYIIAIRLLYEPIRKLEDIELADSLLKTYFTELKNHFGDYAYDYTIHAHLHLAEQVRKHGPLHSHSQFVFEGAINNLKNLINGTNGFINQVTKKVIIMKSFDNQFKKFDVKNEQLQSFKIQNLMNKVNPKNEILEPKNKQLSTEIRNILNKKFSFNVPNVLSGSRYSYRLFLHSKSYNRKQTSNSYTVSFNENGCTKYGEILEFYEIENEVYAVINVFKKCKMNLPVYHSSFLYEILKKNGLIERFFCCINRKDITLDIILCKNISNKCIVVKNSHHNEYITEVKYEYEHD